MNTEKRLYSKAVTINRKPVIMFTLFVFRYRFDSFKAPYSKC